MSKYHRKHDDTENSRHRVEQKEETPELYSIFCGEVASIQPYGAFVKIPGCRKNGLVHITQISVARVEEVSEVLAVGDRVFCKVISLGDEENAKISLSMKVVDQGNGKDLDANLVQTKQEEQRRKKGQTFVQPKIELGAVFNTVCRKCGTKGHLAKDCFKTPGSKTYDLLPDDEIPLPDTEEITPSSALTKKKKKKEKKKRKSKKHRHRSVSSDSTDSDSDSLSGRHSHEHPHKPRHTSKDKGKSKKPRRHSSPSAGSSDSARHPHKHRRTSKESSEMTQKRRHHRSASPHSSDSGLSDKHRRKHRHTSTGNGRNQRPNENTSYGKNTERPKIFSPSGDEHPHRHHQKSQEKLQQQRSINVDDRDQRTEHSSPPIQHSESRRDSHRHGSSKSKHR